MRRYFMFQLAIIFVFISFPELIGAEAKDEPEKSEIDKPKSGHKLHLIYGADFGFNVNRGTEKIYHARIGPSGGGFFEINVLNKPKLKINLGTQILLEQWGFAMFWKENMESLVGDISFKSIFINISIFNQFLFPIKKKVLISSSIGLVYNASVSYSITREVDGYFQKSANNYRSGFCLLLGAGMLFPVSSNKNYSIGFEIFCRYSLTMNYYWPGNYVQFLNFAFLAKFAVIAW